MHAGKENGAASIPPARAIVREKPLWLMAALVLLFFHEPLTTGTFFHRDLYLLFYGHKAFLADALKHGHVPLWDPLMHGGLPFLGQPANSVLYPTTPLYALLPPLVAFNVVIVLQYVLCAAAAYFLARTLRLSPAAACLVGAAYTLCGFTLSASNLLVLILGLPWLPLLLASAHRAVVEGRRRWIVLAACAATVLLLGVAAELTAMAYCTVAVWILAVPRVSLRRRAGLLLVIVGFAIAMSAAQTLPATEVIRNSSRSLRREYATFVQWSVHPHRLPELIVPQFFGPTDRTGRAAYWGERFEMGYPYILSIYFGVPLLLLAILGAVRGSALSGRARLVLASLATAGLLLSIGGWWPFFSVVYEYVPVVSALRFPVKALELALMPVAVLAGAGAEVAALHRRRLTAAAATAGIALLGFALATAASPALRTLFAQAWFRRTLAPESWLLLQRSFAHAGVVALILTAVLAWRRLAGTRFAFTLAAVVATDLAVAGLPVNPYAPREIFDRPPMAEEVARLTAAGGRLFRAPSPYRTRVIAPSTDIVWFAWLELQVLGRYTAANWRIPTIFTDDYDGLAPLRISRATPAVRSMPWPPRIAVLSAAGVTAILTPDEVRVPGVVRTATYRNRDGSPLYLYANANAQPVRFAATAEFARTDEEAFRRLSSRPFAPWRVVLTGKPRPQTPPCRGALVTVKERSDESMTVETAAGCAGWVVFASTWYPGWDATVDGEAAPVELADYAFSAVPVPAGRHVVRRTYRPRLVGEGLAVSFAAAALLLIVASRIRLHPAGTDSRIAPP